MKIPTRVLRIRYSFRLGFIITVLFGILVVTGVYLMFFYTPAVGSAYGDMQHLRTGVGFGQLVRNVHRWSAHLMVLAVFLHLVRTFYAGAYKKPREFNWVIGVMLLLLTLGLSFTGYLLPWDQLSYWAVTVGTNLTQYVPVFGKTVQNLLIGGPQIGQSTLLRFYALHVAVLPLVPRAAPRHPHLAGAQRRLRRRALVGRRVRGGSDARPAPAVPATAPAHLYGGRTRVLGVVDRESVTAEERSVDDTVFTWPHLLVRHVVVALGVSATVLALGVAFVAPLAGLGQPEPDTGAGQGTVVLRRPAGAPQSLRSADRRHPDSDGRGDHAAALAVYRSQSLDGGSSSQGGHRRVLGISRHRRGADGHRHLLPRSRLAFIAPWTHSYVEL